MKKRIIVPVVALLVSVSALLLGAEENYTYNDNIKTILNQNGCIGCHSYMGTYDALMARISTSSKTKDVPVVYPAKADSSVVVWRLEGELPDGSSIDLMPMGGSKLASATIQQVRDWIDQGAPEETVGVDDTKKWGEIKSLFK